MKADPYVTLESGVAQIVDDTGYHFGMAFVVGPHLAVTCAHVVNAALDRDVWCADLPPCGAVLLVRFPIVLERPVRRARIEQWRAPGGTPRDDIALLRLEDPAPEEAGIAILADVQGFALDQDALSVFGVPPESKRGVHVDAKFVGRADAAWTQIDDLDGKGSFIERGYSGAGAWDHRHRATVGMVVARHKDATARVAYMIAASEIIRFLPGIPHERRKLSASFAAAWTLFGGFFFLTVLGHFLAERDKGFPSFLSLGGGNQVVASLWGMQLTAVLMPFVLWMLITFATAFKLHPWWMRVPEFGGFSAPPRPSSTRFAATSTLILLVVLPLYAQGHFIRRFHGEGHVYIYPGKFGLSSEDIKKIAGQHCHEPSVHYCTHPEAGRYLLVPPRPPSTGAYYENAYHFGNRLDEPKHSVTFFPIAQPILVLLITGLCVCLAGIAGWRVFRRS